MDEPAPEEMRRALVALSPFVAEYRLPVNPEDLELMVYAMLRHLRSPEPDEAVIEGVKALIEEQRVKHEALSRAMRERE